MEKLLNYEQFVNRVNQLGFMALSNILPGLPSVADETPKEAWHTGEPDTDPWCWKDRAAEEKRLAFGCILGGHKGFISQRLYPYFYAACHPAESIEFRWQQGLISPEAKKLWELFKTRSMLDTSDIRQALVTEKKSSSKADNAVIELQRHFYITVAGNRRKLNKAGEPYGWPANVYDRVEDWAPAAWLQEAAELDGREAGGFIIQTGLKNSSQVTEQQLGKVLKINTL